MTDSQRLLADFAKDGSEAAFRELVTRYTDLVYSTAVRLVDGNTYLAQDVTQNVFLDLAKMARQLSSEVMLGGWLHRHTCFVAATVLRGERRRQSRETQAAQMNALQDHSKGSLAQVAPILDDAINQLGIEDRAAIVLRFFEESDFRSVGEKLGINENAARMRVTRALEKLNSILKHRGVTFSATALGTVLATEAVTAAPVGLAASISATVLASLAANSGSALTFLKIITMTKLKTGIFGAIIIAGVATPLVIHRQAQAQLRDRDSAFQRQSDQLAQLTAENARLSNLIAHADTSVTQSQSSELLRLRGEVGVLKGQLAEALNLQERSKRAAQAQRENVPADQQREAAMARLNYPKHWMTAFLEYAAQNQGLCPTNFDQAIAFYSGRFKDQTNLMPDQFEIVYQGSFNDLPNRESIIVIREKEAVQSFDGVGWHRAYGFADGHAELHKAVDGNFQAWEQQRMIAPPLAAAPGQ